MCCLLIEYGTRLRDSRTMKFISERRSFCHRKKKHLNKVGLNNIRGKKKKSLHKSVSFMEVITDSQMKVVG